MSKKWREFFFSFGMMLAGLVLLFFGSVSFTHFPAQNLAAQLPLSVARAETGGGDIFPANLPTSRPAVPLAKDDADFNLPLTAAAAVALDDQTNAILFTKNADEARPLASITKLMSALVLAELPLNWSSTTVVSADDTEDGSSHHINAGEEFALEELWQVGLIGSSNSAIHALVRQSGLTEEQFVGRMNEKAKALRLGTAHFEEPTGLSGKNIASALDAARLLKAALAVDKIFRALQVGEYYVKPLHAKKSRRVWATDWLLTKWIPSDYSADEIAGKTGYIADAGYNFAVRLRNDDNRSVRVVVLGATANEARFTEARDLASWAFNHYLWPDQAGYGELH